MSGSTRTHEWTDPDEMARAVRGMSGREFFEAWSSRTVTPPIAAAIGFDLEDFGDGRVVIACVPKGFHYNPYGTVHGGVISTLLDTAAGCAVHTRLPAGTGYATIDLSVSYLRPVTTDTGRVECAGEVVSLGRRVGMSEADLTDGSGKLLARATSHCLLIEG